jgi:hypothetical protein
MHMDMKLGKLTHNPENKKMVLIVKGKQVTGKVVSCSNSPPLNGDAR